MPFFELPLKLTCKWFLVCALCVMHDAHTKCLLSLLLLLLPRVWWVCGWVGVCCPLCAGPAWHCCTCFLQPLMLHWTAAMLACCCR